MGNRWPHKIGHWSNRNYHYNEFLSIYRQKSLLRFSINSKTTGSGRSAKSILMGRWTSGNFPIRFFWRQYISLSASIEVFSDISVCHCILSSTLKQISLWSCILSSTSRQRYVLYCNCNATQW